MPNAPTASPGEVALTQNEGALIEQTIQGMQDEMRTLAQTHPELRIALQLFQNEFAGSGATQDPIASLARWRKATIGMLMQLKSVINPTGLPLDVTPDGRIKSKTFRSATVISTDIQGFTQMTIDAPRVMDTDIFDILSYDYYSNLMEVLRRYDCHLYSFAGDGTLILSREKIDDGGRITLPALDNAVLCAADLHLVLSCVADAWKVQGLVGHDNQPLQTRIGLKFGPVKIGDALAPDGNPQGMRLEFQRIFRKIVEAKAPHYGPPKDFAMKIWGVHGISPVQNQAARLQSALENKPEFVCALMLEDAQQLCSPLQKKCSEPWEGQLKGIQGNVQICGFPKLKNDELVALREECLAYYEKHETYH